jgi:predicted transcriptional regulator
MKTHIRDRMPKELADDLYNRRKTVREVARIMGVTENYVSHALPERAPKKNPKLLKVTRRLYQNTIAQEVLDGKHTVYKGAELAHISERTMFRRMRQLKEKQEKRQQNLQQKEQTAELTDVRVS